MKFKEIKRNTLSTIFTRRCKFCEGICDVREDVCDSCKEDTPKIEGEICYKCGLEKKECRCIGRGNFIYYESICAPYYYEGAPERAIKLFKFAKRTRLADGFCEDMAKCVLEKYKGYDFDLCTFPPSHPDDERERGFNQSRLLAEKIGNKLNIPCEELLIKGFRTAPQHLLPPIKRSGNLLGAIGFKEEFTDRIKNARILLIDDIKTSGETLNECSKTLLINGAAEVRCVTFCITKTGRQKNSRKN